MHNRPAITQDDSHDATFPAEAREAIADALRHVGDPSILKSLEAFRRVYARLEADQKLSLFKYLAIELELGGAADSEADGKPTPADQLAQDVDLLKGAINLSDADTVDQLLRIRDNIEAPRQHVLREFVNMPGGIKFLVDLRADLLDAMKQHREIACLKLVDADLLHLFRSWFNFGFLRLVPINWQSTPAAQLEKLIEYEVVHPMTEWADLRARLRKDRLCYAFYHPNMPDEPLIFVEIALTTTVFDSIDMLFDPANTLEHIEHATTAMFYSINATQGGLGGVSLGNSLIKMVVAELKKQYPWLKRFATLSPMPLFRSRFVEPLITGGAGALKLGITHEQLPAMFGDDCVQLLEKRTGKSHLPGALAATLANDNWADDDELSIAMKPGMLRLAHHYLTHEKRGHSPFDPVANFHLRNGAQLYNINYLSNTGSKGMAESFGITVNYLYDLTHIDEHQQMMRKGAVPVARLLERMIAMGTSA